MRRLFVAGLVLLALTATTQAAPAGETYRVATEPVAALRNADQRPDLRITIWYPAEAAAVEQPITIGPPGKPVFDVGSVAPDAPFAADGRHPVILLSHGYGGSAQLMGWFGIAMARDGYVVIAVDHPGNNGADPMTVAGASLWWDRAEDLRTALRAAEQDPVVAPHVDASRIGVAGFSAGGFTALVAAGARVDRDHFRRFCTTNPDDGVCRPQREFKMTPADVDALFARLEYAAELAKAPDDHAVPGVRAAFAISPALVQALDQASLEHMTTLVQIMLGDADTVAPPATNGLVAARLIPHALLTSLPGVGHLDFNADCTEAGRAVVPLCKTEVPQAQTHRQAIEAAQAFFDAHVRTAQ
jgi:predicted dienelactone hydrolase